MIYLILYMDQELRDAHLKRSNRWGKESVSRCQFDDFFNSRSSARCANEVNEPSTAVFKNR
jgi:hypothetical protein